MRRNKGLSVYGNQDWCIAIDWETGQTWVFGDDEIDRIRGLVWRANRLLAEGMSASADEVKAGLTWLMEHRRELDIREPVARRSELEPEDVDFLVVDIEHGILDSKVLTKFEKAVVRRTLRRFSPMERKAFVLKYGFCVTENDSIRLLQADGGVVRRIINRVLKKLEIARKREKTPRRYKKIRKNKG